MCSSCLVGPPPNRPNACARVEDGDGRRLNDRAFYVWFRQETLTSLRQKLRPASRRVAKGYGSLQATLEAVANASHADEENGHS
jgi:hypothetical protein